jgi:hypothetical protein
MQEMSMMQGQGMAFIEDRSVANEVFLQRVFLFYFYSKEKVV